MKRENENSSIQIQTNQLVRHYRIPVERNTKDVLDSILDQIKLQKNIRKRKSIKLSPVIFTEIAAAFIALFLVLHFFTVNTIFSGQIGESTAFRLPDNSRVVLQDNSNIRYKKYFWKRKVSLDGTAYFEVEKGSKFRVKTKLGKIEVLGTRFLVSEEEDSLKVLCYAGQVKTTANQNSFILEPGTKYIGTKELGEKVSVSSKQEYPDFASFNKDFLNIDINEVIKSIESFFDVQIDIENVKRRSFSGSIQTGKLESALDIVCQSMQLNYRYANKYRIVIFK
jgi:ferric-dicitrate binding protein FerR (iron transport regulator)